MTKKTAIILFNLGGPDKLEEVKPFLFNLFNDQAIINFPQPFRFFLAIRRYKIFTVKLAEDPQL
jgi:ferrochelatase